MTTKIHDQIISDHSKVISMMTPEENKIALECSQKIKSHLEKALRTTGDQKYARNLEVINGVISAYRKSLNPVKTSFYDGELGLAS